MRISWPLFLAVRGASRENKLLHHECELRRVNQIGRPRTEGAHHRQVVSPRWRTTPAASHAAASAAGRQHHYREKYTCEDCPVKQPTTPLTKPAAQQYESRQTRECQP